MSSPSAALRLLVSDDDLAAVEHLELFASRLVQGMLTGRHDSRMKGGCSEFAEHRAYSLGDEVRNLDWRVMAKTDRYYVKQFHEESNLSTVLVLDASGSMAYGDSTASKFVHARAAAACLTRLLLGQRDPVALAVAGGVEVPFVPARSTPAHLFSIIDSLSRTNCGGKNALLQTLDRLVRQVKHRSQFILLTDAFVDVDRLEALLRVLPIRGHELLLFQVLAPEELSFPFREGIRFESLEGDSQFFNIDPTVFADTYLDRMQSFIIRLRQSCLRAGGDYYALPTHVPVGKSLADYLKRRAQRSGRAGGRPG